MKKRTNNSKDKKKLEIERDGYINTKLNNVDNKFQNYKFDNLNLLRPKNLRLESNNKNKVISRNEIISKLGNKQSLTNSKSYSILHNKIQSTEKTKITKNNNSILLNDPLYNQIKFLWDQLGVNKYYQIIFDNFCIQLDLNIRERFFNNELNNLNIISNLIKDINSNIAKRKNYILLIKKNDNEMNVIKNKDIDEILQKVKENLTELRRTSILIIEKIIKLREVISYDLFNNKYENGKINNYNSNYLIEMNNDLDFLYTSNFSKYFSFSNENDPFLTSLSNNSNSKPQQNIIIPIEDDMIKKIEKYQCILLNEILINEYKKKINYRYFKSLNNNSNHSLISTKSTGKLNKSNEANYEFKIKKKMNNNNKRLNINKSIKSYNHFNKKKNGFKKQIPMNYLTTSKYINNYERSFSKGKLKYEETKTDIPKGKIEVIYDKKKSEEKIKIDDKKNQRNNKNNNINLLKDEKTLLFDEFINKSLNNKINIERQEISKNSLLKNDFSQSQQSENNVNEINSETITLSKNEEEIKENIKNIDKEEFIDNDIKEETASLNIKIYSGNVSDFVSKFKSTINIIPEEQKIGFHINNDIYYYMKGIYPKILIIEEEKKIKGLSIIYYDPIQICKSIKISLICTVESDIFSKALQLIKNFCDENYEYDELRLDLYYGMKDGQFYLIESLEKNIKDEKFKWVNMENDGKDRKIKYKYSNPNLSPESILNQSSKNVIQLKTSCIISLDSINNSLQNTLRTMNELNNFGVMCIIEELISQYNYRIEETNIDSKFREFLNNIKPNKFKKITYDFIQTQLGSSNDIDSFIKENLNELYDSINKEILQNELLAISLMKVESSFETIIQTNYYGYKYNIISNGNIEVFSYTKNENDNEFEYFYFLRTSNDNLSFIIYELKDNSNINDLINMNSEEDNIYDEFQRVYMKMNNQPLKSMKRILIPSFKIENKNTYNKPSFLNAIQLSNDEETYEITHLNQIEKFEFSIEKNKDKSKLSFNDINIENDIIINNNFLIVLINSDLLCDLQIPTISAFIVDKKKWEKEEN